MTKEGGNCYLTISIFKEFGFLLDTIQYNYVTCGVIVEAGLGSFTGRGGMCEYGRTPATGRYRDAGHAYPTPSC